MLRKTLLATLCAGALISAAGLCRRRPKSCKANRAPLKSRPITTGLEHPWALAFLPDRQGMLVTERPGNLRRGGGRRQAVGTDQSGVPQVWAKGQGGLLDVVLSPDFKQDRLVYLSYAEGGGAGDKAGTAVGRGRLVG